jgi:hypothetical protein
MHTVRRYRKTMPKIRALQNSSDRKAGDEWDATDEQARILTAADLPGGAKAEYVDRALRAVEPPQPQPKEPDRSIEKRRYLRRDMRAQS